MATKFGIRNYGRSGNNLTFTVVALNPDGTVDTGYTGPVTFNGGNTSFPQSYTFTAADQGQRAFTATISNADFFASVVAQFPGNFEGNAVLAIARNSGGDNVSTGAHGDHVWVSGPGNDAFTSGDGNDLFRLEQGGTDVASGRGGSDGFYFGGALTVADQVDGGADRDYVTLLGNYAALSLGAGFVNVELVTLLSGSSTLYGNPGTNLYDYVITSHDANVAAGQQLHIDGGQLRAGEDLTFNGGAETDGSFKISGGFGVDTLTGGAKSDFFSFAEGRWGSDDVVNGGAGSARDQLALRGDYTVAFGSWQLNSIESIVVLSGYDTRANTDYDYTLIMSNGNVAAGTVMTIDAGQLRSDETLAFFGHNEMDGSFKVFGGAGDDQVLGSHNADIIKGGGGADSLYGRQGADQLTGGGGNDGFAYDDVTHSDAAGMDTILDFTTGDLIRLSTIDANTSTAGDDAFVFIGSAAFTNGTPGQLRVYEDAAKPGHWFVEADVNGDAVADFVLEVYTTDLQPLDAPDFVL